MKKLYRSTKDRVLTGVLGGIAEYTGTDSTIIRLIFMVAFVFTGFFPLGIIYLFAYLIIPEPPSYNSTVSEQ